MAFATASSPANRKPGATRKPQHHPKRKRDRVNRQGTPNPLRAPEPASAHQAPSACQAPQRARARQRMPEPPAHAGTPDACQDPSARRDENRAPERQPSRPSDFGALIEPSIGLRDVNRAERRVPRALAGPSSEFPLRKIANFVQPWSKETILRRLRAKTHDSSRYRKPTHEQPTKTSVSRFRDREKPSVLTASDQNRRFFASRTPPTANPILNKQRSRHQSRRWRASSPGSRTPITGTGFYHHRDWSGVTIPEYCRILNAYLRHYNERRPKGKLG